jgi:glucose/arabinose dehydrogenase
MKWQKIVLIVVLFLAVVVTGAFIFRDNIAAFIFRPTESNVEDGKDREDVSEEGVLVTDLKSPWDIIFISKDEYLISEREGNIKYFSRKESKDFPVSDVYANGEGGLLGIVAHPEFKKNNYIYVYQTTRASGQIQNKVDRYIFKENSLTKDQNIISNIPGAFTHNGGRIAFGPDSYLYITTGDAQNPDSAQNTNSLAGKILRFTDEGVVPPDNPFKNAIYSYGHRNPQGMAWDSSDRLWATEHGPSANDEINLIEKGANYGWPVIRGTQNRAGMRAPLATSGGADTWAPSGLTFYENRLFFAGLRGQSLFEALVTENTVKVVSAHFRQEFGRLRTVKQMNGYLYILTNNTDGRGTPSEGDDRLIKIKIDF